KAWVCDAIQPSAVDGFFVQNSTGARKKVRTPSANGAAIEKRKRRGFRSRRPTRPPTSASSVGVEATSAHGHTGSTSAPQSASPVEPGGVSYTSSPQKPIPQNHHTTYDTGSVAAVQNSHKTHARAEPIINPYRRAWPAAVCPRVDE